MAQGVLAPLQILPYGIAFGYSTFANTGIPSGTRNFTLTNQGGGPVTIGTITTSTLTGASPGANFLIVTDGCSGKTLANTGDTCTESLAFLATGLGPYTGVMTVPSNAAGSPQTATLSGTGIAPAVNLGSAVSFGNSLVGATDQLQKTATVKNTNSIGVTISNVGVSGDFGIVNDGCSGILAANSSCTVTVSFSPTAYGARTGALTFSGNFSNTGGTINLAGNGTLLAPTFMPSSLAFGGVTVGNTAGPNTVTVTNPNVVGMTFTSATVTTLSTDYAIVSDTCSGNTIAASGTCTISASFKPIAVGNRAGHLTIVDQGGSGTQKYAMSGSGK